MPLKNIFQYTRFHLEKIIISPRCGISDSLFSDSLLMFSDILLMNIIPYLRQSQRAYANSAALATKLTWNKPTLVRQKNLSNQQD
ncbi:MAG: hypothetical protein ACR5LF_13840 [Symbiopectobacterium sp.]